MKVKYEFATETVDVEVEEIWGEMLMDMDRMEYNNDHKETRRHASLNELNLDDAYLSSDYNLEDEILRKEEINELVKALEILSPEQLHLVKSVYFEGKSMTDIARSEGVSKMAITYRMKVVIEKIKKVSF
jgi:RNA polymerase sigma-70 factor (ECF subfamily)